MVGRRLVLLLSVVCLALKGVHADPILVAADDAPAKASANCAANLSLPNPPVAGPLAAILGERAVRTIQAFITSTPFGKVLAPSSASSCIANMNGTVLGETIKAGLEMPQCRSFENITSLPLMKKAIDALATGTSIPINDFLKAVRAVPNDEVDQFCTLYVNDIVPCISNQLLPSLVVIREQHSNGCCDDWMGDTLNTYGYSISGQITKMAQLFGDLVCAKQTPSFSGDGSQRCGFTLVQSLLRSDDVSTTASLLQSIQVPTDQMCLRAEGQPYTDTNGKKIAKEDDATMSGCVVALDRAATWMYGLPVTKRSELFDVKSFFEPNKCLAGSELLPSFKFLLDDLITEELAVYFRRSCVHLAIKYADGCNFSRPASLIEWESEPTPVKVPDNTKEEDGTVTAPPETAAPVTTPSSVASFLQGSVVMLIVTVMCLLV